MHCSYYKNTIEGRRQALNVKAHHFLPGSKQGSENDKS